MRDVLTQPNDIEGADMRTTANLNNKYTLDVLPEGRAKPIITTQKHRNMYVTHTKHKLTFREARFIDSYMVCGDAEIAAKEAGFTCKDLRSKGNKLLKTDYIADEIGYRNEIYASAQIADRQEIMAYFTAVMRGEVKDQFGLDAPLGERTAAARELAKRIIDVPEKANQGQNNVIISLDWHRDEAPETVVDIQQLSD